MSRIPSNNHHSRRPRLPLAGVIDRHLLYEASVQSVEADLDFFKRLSRQRRGKPLRRMTEDFCGTAVLACTFVKQHPEHRAWGVDLDADTLDWCRRHNFPVLGKRANRLKLLHGDVLHTPRPRVDLVTALNFSYWVFETREVLRQYFRKVRSSLVPDGFFVLDAFGGSEAMGTLREKRRIPASTAFDGRKVPGFTYIWNQHTFNSIDHHMVCHIGFGFRDGSRRERAFSYDWRMWTLPELQEILHEAGFSSVEVFMEGWDHSKSEPDGIFRRRKAFDNQEGWIGYVVAYC